MIIKHNFEIGFSDVSNSNTLTNTAIIRILEDIAGMHSNLVGYGMNNIKETGLTWVLLNWKLRVFSRPHYGETIHVETWSRKSVRIYCYRDFKIYDNAGNVVAIATSKWVLLDANTMSIKKISPEILSKYESEDIPVFENEPETDKIICPEVEPSNIFLYTIARRDIDINKHLHNLYYLDLAYETLPENIYQNIEFNQVEIMYKKEIKYNDKIKCFYYYDNNEHYVAIKSDDETTLHATIRLCP